MRDAFALGPPRAPRGGGRPGEWAPRGRRLKEGVIRLVWAIPGEIPCALAAGRRRAEAAGPAARSPSEEAGAPGPCEPAGVVAWRARPWWGCVVWRAPASPRSGIFLLVCLLYESVALTVFILALGVRSLRM